MLGKLLKYDIRAMWKQFSIIWPAALIIALINRCHWITSNSAVQLIGIIKNMARKDTTTLRTVTITAQISLDSTSCQVCTGRVCIR